MSLPPRYTPSEVADHFGWSEERLRSQMYGCSLGTIQYYLKYREKLGHEPAMSQVVDNQ